jgi:hypothetical protein
LGAVFGVPRRRRKGRSKILSPAGSLLYAGVCAVVLFIKVAPHQTRVLSLRQVGLWSLSLCLWPLLLLAGRNSPPPA